MKALLAIDGSECARVALDLARAMRWPAGSTIELAIAIEPREAVMGGAWAPGVAHDVDVQLSDFVSEAETVLGRAADELRETGAQIEVHILRGRAATCIVDLGQEIGAELIVVGSRGHGSIGSMVLGSVSAEVADHAHCPVLVARKTGLGRVLLGTDGSSYARAAEDVLVAWGMFAGAQIEVVSVANLTMPWSSGLVTSGHADGADSLPETSAAVIEEYRAVATSASARLVGAGRSATARTVQGDPAAELLRVAREEDADLIVVGTHGRTGLRRLVAGSVARNVMLHAPCSVLIVRAEHPQE